jgi:hypothetical protein
METRHVKATLSAMTVKTDRKDARGLAQLIRMGWFRPVHVGVVTRKGFEARIRELVTGHITLERIAGAMLSARATLKPAADCVSAKDGEHSLVQLFVFHIAGPRDPASDVPFIFALKFL